MKINDSEIKTDLKSVRKFNRFSAAITKAMGRPITTILAFVLVIAWAITGPLFNFSNGWQLVINTGTTIITFLMVFIIQQSQNRDTAAIHLKLNELIASSDKASNRLVDIEDLTEEELALLKKFYIELSDRAERENDLHSSHSLDDVESNHKWKFQKRKEKWAHA